MTSPTVSHISKTLLSMLFVACLICTPLQLCAQNYTEEEYKVFQDVQAEKAAAKKTDMIIKFLKEKPKNDLRPYMIQEFQQTLVNLSNAKQWSQIISLGDKFLAVVPGDDFTINYMTAAYAQTKNYKGFATFGEKAYAIKPSPDLAQEISRAYQKIGNNAKYLEWRQKVLSADPNNIEVLVEMTKKNLQSANMSQSVKYARMLLQALPNAEKPESMDDRKWKESIDQSYAIAYAVIGANSYQNGSYAAAIKNLDQAVKYYKRIDTAYYFLGMSYWRLNNTNAAMLNFAKAYIIGGSTAASAKKNLDEIWKSSRRGSSTGVERVIERARQDLK